MSIALLPKPIKAQLQASHAAQGMQAASDVAWAIERASFGDLRESYARLLKLVGRSMSDADPLRSAVTHREIFPLSSVKSGERLELLHLFVMPAMRNAQATDAERHWRIADALIKGWCLAEAHKYRVVAEWDRSHEDEIENAESVIAESLAQAVRCESFGEGRGW